MSTPRVIGLDLSLTSTGIAGADWAVTIPGGPLPRNASDLQRWERIRAVRTAVGAYTTAADLVVIEAPSYGSNDPGAHERAALWWFVLGRCYNRDVPVVTVAPVKVKVYATGRGHASKEDVVQEVQRRRPDVTFRGNDQADALTLAAMGLDHLGHPPVLLPQAHRRALDGVQWPVLAGAA